MIRGPRGVPTAGVHPAAARLLRWLLLAYTAFVVYGSLVPLHFRPLPMDQAWDQFMNAPFLQLGIESRADWVANLLLFVPQAFLMRAVLPTIRSAAGSTALALGVWLVCTGMAAAVEFTQVFFPGRTVSLNDPLAESVGALIGLLLYRAKAQDLLNWLQGWWLAETGQPLATRALHGYLVGLLIVSVMPLDLTISPVEIFHKMRAGRVVLLPFSDLPGDWAQAVYDLATDLLLWVPVGLLWRWQGRTVAQVFWRGSVAAAAVELAQLFVFSRVTSTTDVISGALGCAIGALLVWRNRAGAGAPAPGADARSSAADWPWGGLTLAWAVLVLAVFWFPFNVNLDGTWLAQRWHEAWRVPFSTYYQGTEFHALNELLRKLLFFVPGGLLWALHVAREYPWRRPGLIRLGCWCLPLVALLLEAGQLLLPGKVADLTDAAIEASGAWLGLLLGRQLWHAPAARRQPTEPGGLSPPPSALMALPRRRPAVLVMALSLAVTAATAVTGWQALAEVNPGVRPSLLAWLVVWLLILAAATVRIGWQAGAAVAAFFTCQFITPRYEPAMGLLLATPALPGMAAVAVVALGLEHRRGAPGALRLGWADGLFLLFFGWVGVLGSQAWLRQGATGFDPLYHPANYALCALLYAAGRLGGLDTVGVRRIAASVAAAVAAAAVLHLANAHFSLNGQLALLLALTVPLWLGLAGSASSSSARAGCWAGGAAAAALVVFNQNRSALLGLLAMGVCAVVSSPSTPAHGRNRRQAAVAVLAFAAVAAAGLMAWLGLWDRFLSLMGNGVAIRHDDTQAVQTVQSRLALWQAAWHIVQSHPLAGVGPGLFEQVLAQTAPGLDKVPAHNTWLTLLAETGVVGALLGTLAFLAAWTSPAGPVTVTTGAPRTFDVARTARLGLVVCAVYGLFNSRADFAWAYLLAGWAVMPTPPRAAQY